MTFLRDGSGTDALTLANSFNCAGDPKRSRLTGPGMNVFLPPEASRAPDLARPYTYLAITERTTPQGTKGTMTTITTRTLREVAPRGVGELMGATHFQTPGTALAVIGGGGGTGTTATTI